MKTVYEINDREAGNKIEVCASLEQAEATVRRYEEIDIAEGTYTPNFYEIVEIAAQKIKNGEKTMKTLNKTGIADIKRKIDSMYDCELEPYLALKTNERKKLTIDHSFRDNGNTWTRSTVYLRKTKGGNLIIEW